ncbi:hypothetical protein [Verticiella sediminum]|nr:hypothetical protein [Verticiella sediminum]
MPKPSAIEAMATLLPILPSPRSWTSSSTSASAYEAPVPSSQ